MTCRGDDALTCGQNNDRRGAADEAEKYSGSKRDDRREPVDRTGPGFRKGKVEREIRK